MARRKKSKKQLIRQRRIEALKMLGVAFIFIIVIFLTVGRLSGADAPPDSAQVDASEEDAEAGSTAVVSLSADGWRSTLDGWYYVDEEGTPLTAQWATIEGRNYYFGEDSYMATGWYTIDGELYHLTQGGELHTDDWFTDSQGKTYHLNANGIIDTGWLKTDDGSTYYLGEDGVLQTGLKKINGSDYFFDTDGSMMTGWIKIGDTDHHFGTDGAMSTGWFTDEDGSIYFFQNDGSMAHSWLELDGKKYFPGVDGILDIGWTRIDGNQYYFLEDGSMAIGQVEIEGQSYVFGDNGILANGLTSQDGKLYYYDENGSKRTGIINLDSGTYFFGGDDGSAQQGWVTDDSGNRYYMDEESFTALTGWQTLNNEMCYFTSEGIYDPNKSTNDMPTVALTFDDGPGYYTDRLLDILVENDATATFFMIGQEIELYKEQVKREYELGMEQAVHTYHHKNLRNLTAEEIREELGSTYDLLEEVTGHRPAMWRPPGGAYNDTVLENDFGTPLILWSLDTLDWKTMDAQSSVDAVLNNVQDGDIILMHEIYQTSVDAVEIFLPKLKERGFRVVSVSELAKAKGVHLIEDHAYGRIQ